METFSFKNHKVSIDGGVATIRNGSGRVVHVSRGVGAGRTATQAREAARRWITAATERRQRYSRAELREIETMRKRVLKRDRTKFGRFG